MFLIDGINNLLLGGCTFLTINKIKNIYYLNFIKIINVDFIE
tara:strand:- start:29 stop:154 length:126 start_codon:yes stop_codon:yes gene_type:complete